MGQDYIVHKGDTISSIAKKFGVSLKALKAANPQIKNFDLIRTGEKINIPTVPGPINLVGQTYVVQPGDTISNIADQFGVSVEDLEAANPRFKNFDLIQPGDVLNIPDSPGVVPVNLVGRTYVVQPGDTISDIADQFGVSVEDLEAANPRFKNFDLIQPGDVLNIPDSPGVVPVNLVGRTYVVQPGDTISDIADQFGVSVEDLEAANPRFKNFDLIQPGDVLNIPDSPGVVPVNLVGRTYVVQPGDTISNIADQFGVSVEDLEAANPRIKNFDLIQPGDVINIPDSPGVVPVNLVGQTYVVKPGDTFSSIADQFGVSVEDLEAANPQIKNFDLIHPGDVINVPTSDTKSELGPGATPQLVHFKNEIESGSKTAKVPVNLIAGMIWQESRANPNASSNHGKDTGLMQINDDTFNDMRKNHPIVGSHKNDPATNILGGSFYLSEMYSQFGDYPLALRAYNSGPESVDPKDPNQTGGVGDPNYVRNVLKFEKIIATGNGKLDP